MGSEEEHNLGQISNFGDLGINDWIILKWNIKKYDAG
jgi:hypothetical protein